MMLQLVTDAVISKGYGGAPAFYSSEDGRMISFKIGCKVFPTAISMKGLK